MNSTLRDKLIVDLGAHTSRNGGANPPPAIISNIELKIDATIFGG
jgi:hypothetical protein